MTEEKTLVTCALPYANGAMHIGHIRSTYLPGDIYARYLKMTGADVAFICASDEHGTPITVRADKEKTTPDKIAKRYHDLIKTDFDSLNIKFDVFSRTSNKTNIKNSQDFFTEANKKGYIYTKEVEQYFCETCKRFLPDRYVEGTCPECGADGARGDHCEQCGQALDSLLKPHCLVCGSTPKKKTTTHWFFRLNSFKDFLEDYLLQANLPDNVKNYASSWTDNLKDWCITRDMSWGVPVPLKEAKNKVIYVWWDAPIGYISATEDWGGEKALDYWKNGKIVHFIGKDIIYHHALFWPAMLKAHGKYKFPYTIQAGEYLSLEGRKMSTSRNWVVWVKDFVEKYPSDYMRYYLTINTPLNSDMDFVWKDFEARINNELSDVLGNFVHRVLTFVNKFYDGKIPKPGKYDKIDTKLLQAVEKAPDKIGKLLADFNFIEALKSIMELARHGNQYLNEKEPWKSKSPTPLYVTSAVVKTIAILSSPFIPETAQKIWEQLGQKGKVEKEKWSTASKFIVPETKIKEPKPLIKKVEIHEVVPEYTDKKVIVDKEISDLIKNKKCSVALAEIKGIKVQRRAGELERLKKTALKDTDRKKVEKVIDSYRYLLDKRDKGKEGLSSENLVKFVDRAKMLPNVNTVTDIYNMISYKTGMIMGAYDVRAINGNLRLKVTDGKEKFVPIGSGRAAKVQKNEYVLADAEDNVITRWLTKEHEKVKIERDTQGCVVCVQGNKDIPQKDIEKTLKSICDLIVKFCGGEYKIIYPQ
jgi:methionyl-tRNA synthetase